MTATTKHRESDYVTSKETCAALKVPFNFEEGDELVFWWRDLFDTRNVSSGKRKKHEPF